MGVGSPNPYRACAPLGRAIQEFLTMRHTLTACLLPLTLLLCSTTSQALEVSPIKGYHANSEKEKALDVFKVRVVCGTSYCGDTKPGQWGYIEITGRVRERTLFADSKATAVGVQLVAQEYADMAKRMGGQLVNQRSSASGPFVYRFPRAKGGNDWMVLDDSYDGYYSLWVIEEAARESTVTISADDMAAALNSEGDVALYIEFETAKAQLQPAGLSVVQEIVALLKKNPQLKVSIEGHTDNVGNANDNLRLSQARAEAVLKAVVAQGIDAKRLKSAGHGATYPIADNRKETGRAKNRRVELVKL